MQSSTEAGSETHAEAKRFWVWKRRERDGKGLKYQVDGCKGISEALKDRLRRALWINRTETHVRS